MEKTTNRLGRLISLIGAVLGIVLYLGTSLLPAALAQTLTAAAESAVSTAIQLVLGEVAAFAQTVAGSLLEALGGILLALLVWNRLRLSSYGAFRSVIPSFFLCAVVAAARELLQLPMSGREASVIDWAMSLAGAFVTLLAVVVLCWSLEHLPKLVNRETISYVVFGVLTTVVNLVTYNACADWLGWNTALSTTVAWVTAVIFAYVVNKLFVFHSHTTGRADFLREMGMFFGARALTYVIDLLGMMLLVDVLHWHGGLSKILTNILVLVLNYVFSKVFIFRKKLPESDPPSEESDSEP